MFESLSRRLTLSRTLLSQLTALSLATFIATTAQTILISPLEARETEAQSSDRPNIVMILADDHSYDSIHETGNEEIETPNLDKLARQSTQFRYAYNMGSWSGAVCVASRTMLNSGRFVWHAKKLDLKKEEAANRVWSLQMRNAGYETYFTGKWHVKLSPPKIFDHVGSIRAGMPKQTPAGYNRPVEGEEDQWSPYDKSQGGYWEGGKHWSEVVGDKPFFMYIAFNAPHDPRQAPKRFVDKYPLDKISIPIDFQPEYPYKDSIGSGVKLRDEKLAPFPRTHHAVKVNRQEYYAIITHMDEQIGRILEALEKTGKSDNTYVFFTADHGLAVGHHGLMGKQNMHEHSVRVPFFVKGPALPADKKINSRIYLQDIVPTTMELAGIEIPDFVNFRSLVPMMKGETAEHYDSIYGAYLQLQRMVIKDDMKLILYPTINKKLLYDLRNDPLELNNLAESPEQAATIQTLGQELLKLQEQTGDQLDIKSSFPQPAGSGS